MQNHCTDSSASKSTNVGPWWTPIYVGFSIWVHNVILIIPYQVSWTCREPRCYWRYEEHHKYRSRWEQNGHLGIWSHPREKPYHQWRVRCNCCPPYTGNQGTPSTSSSSELPMICIVDSSISHPDRALSAHPKAVWYCRTTQDSPPQQCAMGNSLCHAGPCLWTPPGVFRQFYLSYSWQKRSRSLIYLFHRLTRDMGQSLLSEGRIRLPTRSHGLPSSSLRLIGSVWLMHAIFWLWVLGLILCLHCWYYPGF